MQEFHDVWWVRKERDQFDSIPLCGDVILDNYVSFASVA